MPIFEFQSPDGRTIQIEGSDQKGALDAFNMYGKGLLDKSPAKTGPAQPPSLSWGDVGREALQNAPSSAVRFAKDIVQPVVHPIQTAENVGKIGEGALEKAGVLPGHGEEKFANAVGSYFKDRYGSVDGFKRAIASDPVGVAGDLSMFLTGGSEAAARVPGIIGRVGEVAADASRVVNPIEALGKVAKGIGKGVTEVIGNLGTHTGGEPLRLAARAGFEGGDAAKAFKANMRGNAPLDEAVDDARTALSHMRQQRGEAYRKGMAGVAADKQVLDFSDIDKALKQTEIIKNYKGQSLSPSTQGIRDKITETINDWGKLDPKEFHTAEGLDALKQKIGDIRDATQYGTPERVVADRVYNAIKKTITDKAPEYAKVMRGYELASKEIKEIERTLSLNPKASVDTSLRKLQSILRNNVNTNYGQRKALADYLVKAGAPHLMERLAGQSLNSWTARGLGKLGMQLGAEIAAGMTATAAGAPHVAIGALAAAPLMSPRLMGEAAYAAGAAARPLKVIDYAMKRLKGIVPANANLPAAVQSPLKKWGQASMGFRSSSTPQSLAKLLNASRNLSHNLADIGVQVTPDALVGAGGGPDQQASMPAGVYPIQ